MSWGAIGALALVVVVVFLFGRLWFALVEGVLSKIKRLFSRKQEPTAWHSVSHDEHKEDSQ